MIGCASLAILAKGRQRAAPDPHYLRRSGVRSAGKLTLVRSVAVPAAPVPYARATLVQRRKRAVRVTCGCCPS